MGIKVWEKPTKRMYHVKYKNNFYKKKKNGTWLIWGNMSLFPVADQTVLKKLEWAYSGIPVKDATIGRKPRI